MKGWWRNGDRWKAIKPVPLQLLFAQEWSQIQRMFQRFCPTNAGRCELTKRYSRVCIIGRCFVACLCGNRSKLSHRVSFVCKGVCAHPPPPFGSVVLVRLPRGASLLCNPLCIVFCVRMCGECWHFSDTTHLPWQTVMCASLFLILYVLASAC